MKTSKHIFLNILIFIGAGVLIRYLTAHPLVKHYFPYSLSVLIIPLILALVIRKMLNNRIRVADFLKKDFADMKYIVLLERPLTAREQYKLFKFEPAKFISGISLDEIRYKNRMVRYFKVKYKEDYDFWLIVKIIQTWRNKLKYKIDSVAMIRE